MLDAFHVTRLGLAAVDEVRRRVQQQTLHRRGHNEDPLYWIRRLLRAPPETLSERVQTARSRDRASEGECMFVKLAHFFNIMLYVLVAGVLWGTWLSLARTMTEYDAATFLADGKHMIANLASVMPVLMIATGVLSLVVIILLFRRGATAAAWLALAGLTALVAVIVVTLTVEVPIDNQVKTWTTATLPADWEDIRSRWANFHTLRTFLSLAGLAAAVGAALATAPRLRTLR